MSEYARHIEFSTLSASMFTFKAYLIFNIQHPSVRQIKLTEKT